MAKRKNAPKSWNKLVVGGAVLVGLLVAFNVLDSIKHHFYAFDQDTLAKIARDVLKKNHTTQGLFSELVSALDKQYPGRINVKEEWVFNNAGGAMGALYLLHGSLTEYLIIFGSPIGTEGHTGRYFADDYFIILDGEQWAFSEGQSTREVYKPGDMHHLVRGTAQAYRIPDHCWALEYARGWIPLMLPFGVADTIFSTLDVYTLGRTLWIYGKGIVGQLLSGKI